MRPEDAEDWTEAQALVIEGWARQRVLGIRLGVHEALGLSISEWTARLGRNVPQLAVNERQPISRELTMPKEDGGLGLSYRDAGDVLGVGRSTIHRDIHPQSPVPNGTDGDHRLAKLQVDEPPSPALVPFGTGTDLDDGDEWYTPRWLFSALELTFSIDVCAPLDRTYSAVPAERHFTIEDDGLAQRWDGTVWCNPPYSKPEPWARRMIHHGDGLLLTHMPMNAGWCVDVWDVCDAIRLFQAMEFVRPDGTSQRPGYWLQLAAFGTAATDALARVQPLGDAAFNKRRIASPMWRRAA